MKTAVPFKTPAPKTMTSQQLTTSSPRVLNFKTTHLLTTHLLHAPCPMLLSPSAYDRPGSCPPGRCPPGQTDPIWKQPWKRLRLLAARGNLPRKHRMHRQNPGIPMEVRFESRPGERPMRFVGTRDAEMADSAAPLGVKSLQLGQLRRPKVLPATDTAWESKCSRCRPRASRQRVLEIHASVTYFPIGSPRHCFHR